MFQEIISRLPPKSFSQKTAEPKVSYVSESDIIRYIPILEMKGTARKKSDREELSENQVMLLFIAVGFLKID